MPRISIVGASGYTGGEALRILLSHPEFEVSQVTSESRKGKLVQHTHPNLRGLTKLKFSSLNELKETDVILSGLPHGESQKHIRSLMSKADVLVDLSSDFRLKDKGLYKQYYGHEHTEPEVLSDFVYGIPEFHREELKSASLISGAGCIATCALTSLRPLFEENLVIDQQVFVDAKVGSSAAGASVNPSTHHPERSGCLRSFKATGHRHTAEVVEYLGSATTPRVHLSATSTDSVRGILTTAQVFVRPTLSDLDIRQVYRNRYGQEPFVRVVKEQRGIYRYPEPKLLSGTNFVDIGFELEAQTGRLVVLGAIDNLVKGSAGNAVQSLNIRFGFDETLGLGFPGLHPV